MATIAVLISGGIGCAGFFAAWLGLGFGLWTALGVYILAGTAGSLIVLGLSTLRFPQFSAAGMDLNPRLSPTIEPHQQDALFARADAEEARKRSRIRAETYPQR